MNNPIKENTTFASVRIIFTGIMVFLFLSGHCQKSTYSVAPKFQNLNFEDGISNLSVQSIEQDEQGYIWMATARGLNRYDGISFKHFLLMHNDSNSLFHNRTYDLHKSINGQLFVSTANGVNVFDPEVEKMYRIKSNNEWFSDFVEFNGKIYGAGRNGGLYGYIQTENAFRRLSRFGSTIIINKLITDDETGIWGITSFNKTLINYDPRTDSLKIYTIPGEEESYNYGDILKLDDVLFIATKRITSFSISSGKFIQLPGRYKQLEELKDCEFTFIEDIENGLLWLGTQNKGLFIYEPEQNRISNFTKSNSALRSNHLTTFFKDRDDNIWLGTFDQGAEVSFKQRNIINYDIQLENLTKNSFVTSIVSDNNSNHYIGTRSDGLFVYSGDRKKAKYFNRRNSFLPDNNIRTLFIDSKNQLWISTFSSLHLTNPEFKSVKEIKLPTPHHGILSFCEQDGKIIAGSSLQGFFTLDYDGNILSQNKNFWNDVVKVIPYGNNEIILSSLLEGVFVYNLNTDTLSNLNEIMPVTGYDFNEVVTMLLDSDSTLWLGNYDKGLYKYNFNDKSFRVFTEIDGLPNNDIVCIEEDTEGNLWLGTSYGLSRFNKKEEFINFFQNEGLQNLQFHRNSSHKDNNGLLFFGGNIGLTFFDPQLVGKFGNNETPNITLKSISVRNKEIKPNDETKLLSQILNNTEKITLNHKQNVFTIAYHAFDYIAADKIKYSYILEGLDNNWNDVGVRNQVNFSNLSPGTYSFKVKAQNNIGLWSGVKTLRIIVRPSPFKTPLAYFIYLFVFAVIVYISFKLTLQAKLYRNKLETEHKERIRENEIAQMKMRFFTNISHEIRTPLTLIKGNADMLAKDLTVGQLQSNSFKGLQHSTNRLLALVNQLLSFRSMENDTLHLIIKNNDLIFITNKLIQPFQYVAANRGIIIRVVSEYDKLILPIDEDKYEKIMSNLLSNALKHARENGTIIIQITPLEISEYNNYFKNKHQLSKSSFVKIAVTDNGSGISKNDLPYVFKRFKQSKTDINRPDYSGTGIGLNFTKKLVELHGGAIIARSKPNVETEFSFVLSLDASSYEDDVWMNEKTVAESDVLINTAEEENTETPNEKLPVILVAEDDIELNRFISSSLSNNFSVISCYNGTEGLTLAKKHLPDVIVSDIVMPETDGFQLCKLVRNDKLISHIPIILLTAKTDEESEITGLKYGADDYVSKPFSLSVLTARIYNLITIRKNLQQSYKQGILDVPQETIKNQYELNFIKKINDIVSAEYQSQKLNVNFLADQMNMSRTNFYRKFMNVMDVSPKDFIIKYRINKAIELIKSGEDNFGEISFLCGFGTQSNFSVQFKKEKGVSPLQYKKELLT